MGSDMNKYTLKLKLVPMQKNWRSFDRNCVSYYVVTCEGSLIEKYLTIFLDNG
jgi:hypothetical protein